MLGTDSFELSAEAPLLVLAIHSLSVIDGDTLRVQIVAPKQWEKTVGPARRSQTGEVWIRLLGLDAPETHFPSSPIELRHQPAVNGQYATECLNQALGITASLDDGDIQLFASKDSPEPSTHKVLSYLLAEHRGIDRYGRVLAFIWKTQDSVCSQCPSSNADTHPYKLESSINFSLLAKGAAYPDFYSSLGHQRITCLRNAVKLAQLNGRGIWRADQTRSGILLSEAQHLAHNTLILPRLYRRIATFLLERNLAVEDESLLRVGFRDFLGSMDQPVRLNSDNNSILFSELLSWDEPRLGVHASLENLVWE